jgi:hypothetical protein
MKNNILIIILCIVYIFFSIKMNAQNTQVFMGNVSQGQIIDIEEDQDELYAVTADGIYQRNTLYERWQLVVTLRYFTADQLGIVVDFQIRNDIFYMKINDYGKNKYYTSNDRGTSWTKLNVPTTATNFKVIDKKIQYRLGSELYTLDTQTDVVSKVELSIGVNPDSDLDPVDGKYYYLDKNKLCHAEISLNKMAKTKELQTMPSGYKSNQILTWNNAVYLWGQVDTLMIMYKYEPTSMKMTEQLRFALSALGKQHRWSKNTYSIYMESRDGGQTAAYNLFSPYWKKNKKVKANYTRFVGDKLYSVIDNHLQLSEDFGNNFRHFDKRIHAFRSGDIISMSPHYLTDQVTVEINNRGVINCPNLEPSSSEFIGLDNWTLYQYENVTDPLAGVDTIVKRDSILYFSNVSYGIFKRILPAAIRSFNILKVRGKFIILSNGMESYFSTDRGRSWKKSTINGSHQYIEYNATDWISYILLKIDNRLILSRNMIDFQDISLNLHIEQNRIDNYFYSNKNLYAYSSWTGEIYRLKDNASNWEKTEPSTGGWGKFWYLPFDYDNICCLREGGQITVLKDKWEKHDLSLTNVKVYAATSNNICIMAITNNGVWGIPLHSISTSITDLSLDVLCYPNPTLGFVTIKKENLINPFDIEVLDINGKIQLCPYTTTTDDIHIDMSGIPSGTYIISMYIDRKKYHSKVIKK